MKSFFLGLLLCSAIAALTEDLLKNGYQGRRSHIRIHSLEAAKVLPSWHISGFQKRDTMKKSASVRPTSSSPAPEELKKAASALARSFSGSMNSRGSSPSTRGLERSSGKRKDPDPPATPPARPQRTSGYPGNKNSTPSRSNTNPLGKPPLHPSFKNSLEYKAKMQSLAMSKRLHAQKIRRKMDGTLPDAGFLSDSTKHYIDENKYPLPALSASPRPPPYRSQVMSQGPGRLITIS